jgi:hypothetical protein
MKTVAILASTVVFVSGCSLISGVTGGPSKTSSSPTSHAPGAAKDDGDGTAGAASDGRPTVAGATPGTEAKLAKLLEADARYSASTVQGAGSPLCQARGGYTALSIWNVDFHANAAREGNLDCFVINEQSAFSKPATFSGLRDFQDHGMISKPAFAVVTKPGTVWATVQMGGFWAAEFGDTIRLLEAPNCKKGEGMDSDFLIRHLDAFCDLTTVKFDVLTKDVASAKAVKLEEEKKAFVERAIAAAKQRGEAVAKAEAEALQKVKFPAAVGSDGAAVQAVKDHIASTKTGIEPGSIKKTAMTATWATTKSPIGLVMHRTAEVTVGFARTDAYAIDPNKKCAIASFDVKEEWDGGKFEKPYATGAVTGWTNILCDRLK